MLAWLLSRLPSIRAERERHAALRAELRAQLARTDALLEAAREREHYLVDRLRERESKYDRLVEARLLKDGAIATTLTEPPTTPPSAPAIFGNIGRLVHPTLHHRPADVDADSLPAGAAMSS